MLTSVLDSQVGENGVALVGFSVGRDGVHASVEGIDEDLMEGIARCAYSLPVRFAEIHHCFELWNPRKDILTDSLSKFCGLQVQLHQGRL
jgi:hypothetical protein